jgi:hypothetical protein
MSAATTVESTPPESPQTTRRFPPARGCGHPALDEAFHRPVGLRLADPEHEVPEDVPPVDAVRDLGMELDAVDRAVVVLRRRVRRVVRHGERVEALGRADHLVAVAHPDERVEVADREQRIDRDDLQLRRPNSLCVARLTSPPNATVRTFMP